jgi:hypothetical protein
MSKRLLLGLFVVLAICMMQIVPVKAADTKTAGDTKAAPAKPGARTGGHMMAANTVAVCGCGKVFVPTADTKYVEYNGKRYACCSDPCHEKAAADPAATAKAVEGNIAKLEAANPGPSAQAAPDKK